MDTNRESNDWARAALRALLKRIRLALLAEAMERTAIAERIGKW